MLHRSDECAFRTCHQSFWPKMFVFMFEFILSIGLSSYDWLAELGLGIDFNLFPAVHFVAVELTSSSLNFEVLAIEQLHVWIVNFNCHKTTFFKLFIYIILLIKSLGGASSIYMLLHHLPEDSINGTITTPLKTGFFRFATVLFTSNCLFTSYF